MSARTILKHVYENGGMTEYQYEKIDRVLKERERPHGEWKADGTCSECGVYSSLNKDTTYFCPNCGADMREGEAREE